ncbi:hypothetical protein [Clostridium manihotivorum]|uniref:hypothetical protein n=1 Tax=Clostridium manihotivorum TaxID=2320868 RepID=UPI000FE32893|nr:hypothetical protein [Clostridium manihotivorum]
MKSNIVNKLTIQLNQQFYDEGDIYITIGIKFGFSIRQVFILPREEIKELNQASGEVFVNYIALIMKEKHKINIKGNVKTGITYISMKTNKDSFDEQLTLLLKVLYEDEIDEEIFNKAKELAKDKFSYNYKNVNFRAYYHMMEFSNINKRFNLRNLTKDFLDIDVQSFKEFYENIVILQNSILFINGDLRNLNESNAFNFIEGIKTQELYVAPITEVINDYLQSDVHLVDIARENVSLGGINFSFFNEEVSITEKQLLISIINQVIFKEKGQVLIDEFDNSLVYFNSKLDIYSTKIIDYLNEESISNAKDRMFYQLAFILEKRPYLFNKYCIDLYSKGIDIDEYFGLLNKCDFEMIKDIYANGNLKITDAHLLYVKEV